MAPGAATALPNKDIPWTNCRLILDETENDTLLPEGGVVARLYYSTNSHPAVRQSFHSMKRSKVSLPALALHNLVNKRGPDGLVGCIPGETRHSANLLALCQQCHDNNEVLICSIPLADVVLVPRIPSSAARDSVFFIAYATNIKAVEMCERLRSEHRVALVLDIDNTLVDATAVTLSESDWDSLGWRVTSVTTSTGRSIQSQYAFLPGSDADPFADGSWIIHWRYGRVACTFKVRVRRGWADFRAWLSKEKSRFMPFVCSKGKAEYIQLIWHFLDPRGELIPKEEWAARINSTFPDSLARAAQKTALTALGCAAITQPQAPTQLAAPMCLLDDSADAYEPDYDDSILYVEEYRPSDLMQADQGSVLRQVSIRLDSYWEATCTSAGTFAWQAAQSFATAILGAIQRNPMESPDALQYLQGRCARQGELLGSQIKLKAVFGDHGVYVADQDDMIVDAESPTIVKMSSPKAMAVPGGNLLDNHALNNMNGNSLGSSPATGTSSGSSSLMLNGAAAALFVPMAAPVAATATAEVVDGAGGGGGEAATHVHRHSISGDFEDVVTASLMMRC